MTKRISTVDTVSGDTLLEMVLSSAGDASDTALAAAASVLVGPVREVGDDSFEIVLNGPKFAPVPIETLFTAFQTFLLDTQRAGFNASEREAARDAFRNTVGPLAALIDWSEK